jgi:peptidoglycan/LPS O-acetylase OafA/YrhL
LTTAPSSSTQLDSIDSIRGLAALYVLFHHLWQFAVITPVGETLPGWVGLLSIFRSGSSAVAVFIVISGYCLMLPVARSATSVLRGGLGGFLRRRARRILPPYYAALLGSIGLIVAVPALQSPQSTQWDLALPALAVGPILTHAALIHNLIEPWRWKINPPLWSVALELQIYVVFAVVLLPLWRRTGLLATLCCALLLGFIPVWFGMDYIYTYFLALFALGMAAAVVTGSPERLTRRWPLQTPWHAISILAWGSVAVLVVLDQWMPIHPTILEELAGVATALYLLGHPIAASRAAGARLLAHPLLVGLGRFSYSLYLIHYPLVAAIWMLLLVSGLDETMRCVLLLLAGTPAIVALAYGFHILCERPFLSHTGQAYSDPT